MRIPQIQIQTTNAQIGIQTTNSQLQIQQPKAQMDFQSQQGTIHIEKTPGKLTIDQTEAWAQMNMKHVFRLIAESAQEGKQAASQGIARRAQEGKELMMIENGFGAIASQAKRNGQLPKHEFGLDYIPSPMSVKVHYQPGDVKITAQTHKPMTNITPQKPVIQYQPSSVQFQLQQKNSIQFDVLM